MAQIAPFRGILYDPARIDAAEALSGDDLSTEAFRIRLGEGVLVRDQRPAIYRCHQVFTTPELGGRRVVRRGFVAAVRLQRYGEGGVRPHARASEPSRLDYLRLLRESGAHLTPALALYSDPSGRSDQLFQRLERDARPHLQATTDDGTLHKVWRVCDAEIVGELRRVIAPLVLYIAEGHHRYEAMLEWRDELRERFEAGMGTWSAGEFAMLYLANMEDAGVIARPIHRLVRGSAGFDPGRVMQAMRKYFDVIAIEGGASDAGRIRGALRAAGSDRPSFAAVLAGSSDAVLLTVKVGSSLQAAGITGPRVLTDLDVTLFHELVLTRCLEIDRAAQERAENLSYAEDVDELLARLVAGEAQIGFIMNPPALSQMRSVADAGELMPPKSIAFFPKLPTGLVFNLVDPDEDLG